MATFIYATNVSLDGYIEDAHGAFDWTRRCPLASASSTVNLSRQRARHGV